MITSLTFLAIDDHTSEVVFVSDSFYKFATDKLRDRRESVLDLIIKELLDRRDSAIAMNHLPWYLEQRGKLNEVLECLSPDYCARIVEHSKSLVPLRQQADLGVSTAMELRRDGEIMRFSMQRAAITELEGAEVWRSEIEALMALDDYASALHLAQSTLLKEDRLHLLAVIAKSRRAQGQAVEAELLQQIRTSYDQIDPGPLEERAIDIASDLFSSCPDLAINLVERAMWTEGSENTLDSAYARLSIAALGTSNGISEPHDAIEMLRARIKDPRLQSFTAAVSLAAENQSAPEVIAEVKKLVMAEDCLHFLRHWTVENRERSDAADVVEYALDLAVKTTTYTPNARVLRELAAPLPFMENTKRARRLVGAFDSQKDTIEHIGPTEDYESIPLIRSLCYTVLSERR